MNVDPFDEAQEKLEKERDYARYRRKNETQNVTELAREIELHRERLSRLGILLHTGDSATYHQGHRFFLAKGKLKKGAHYLEQPDINSVSFQDGKFVAHGSSGFSYEDDYKTTRYGSHISTVYLGSTVKDAIAFISDRAVRHELPAHGSIYEQDTWLRTDDEFGGESMLPNQAKNETWGIFQDPDGPWGPKTIFWTIVAGLAIWILSLVLGAL